MTLSQLERIAHVSKLGDADTAGLRDAVLAYTAEVRESESGATPAQRRVLDFYEQYRSEHKRYPTIRQAGTALGVSHVTIFEHTNELVRKGFMRKTPHVSRGLELVR